MRVVHDVYEHDFGLLLPFKSGVVWEHQTDGVMCHHIFIEGVFLPLPAPQGLLSQLTTANYKHNEKKIRRVWREIDKRLFFGYKKMEAPKGHPSNQEGIQWIKITGIKKVINGEKSEKREYERNKSNYGGLIGKTVALIYPNCD